MKLIKMLFGALMMLLLVSSITVAGDFDWVKDFNIKAEADPSVTIEQRCPEFPFKKQHKFPLATP